eukprot:CAMPEP_0117032080 /NCGR_PEP_ID=MMETSP0472-20121206/23021_1 /TAXON_ID=693140 ORGANISM="Tiarina fusus, Strain LIS" /NCGR_SAMPLE_ID=MMETSP0472 /ASSEMBLY_ACC=CAM_ASM_000603 /LENGTH=110 /DNA_ID=CAMNT_0004740613 /DNA_START=48 /DNA_END=381 /DNA_ORIENTATION=+
MIAFGHDESSHPQDSQHPHTPKTLNSISQHPKTSNTIGPLGLQGLGSRVYNLEFRVKGGGAQVPLGGVQSESSETVEETTLAGAGGGGEGSALGAGGGRRSPTPTGCEGD